MRSALFHLSPCPPKSLCTSLGSTHGYRINFNIGGRMANLLITITLNNTTTNMQFFSHQTMISNRTHSGFDQPLK